MTFTDRQRKNTSERLSIMPPSMVRTVILMLMCFPLGSALADDTVAVEDGAEVQKESLDEDDDDTVDIDTEATVDNTDVGTGLKVNGDVRPIFDYVDLDARDGMSESDEKFGARLRLRANYAFTDALHVGARLAGSCFTDDCDPEFELDNATPAPNGLEGGQFTFDELYLHWFRTERGSLAIGRMQTRFVLRGGVYAKSLDRNNSNNVNINWTDGVQGTYRAKNGWRSNLILERNDRDGSGSIRRELLDFDDSGARTTYFVGFENIRSWGPIVQRGFGVSYLPDSLLKDGDLNGRREDYWGFAGRLAFRWPQDAEGIRLRAGGEIGYAPETPTREAANLDTHVSGLAWDIVASIMDIQPGHSIGINYARTGAAWLLSPQFRPNEELFEIRYQWRPDRLPFIKVERIPLIEVRFRWREDLEKLTDVSGKREVFDMYFRLTWEFTVKDR